MIRAVFHVIKFMFLLVAVIVLGVVAWVALWTLSLVAVGILALAILIACVRRWLERRRPAPKPSPYAYDGPERRKAARPNYTDACAKPRAADDVN